MSKVIASIAFVLMLLQLSPALAQQKKSKGEKVAGDVGLLDLEKNYMIVVTKDGKLVTVDFNDKTKVTKFAPKKSKMSDLNLGDAASITYSKKGDKNVLNSIEVKLKAKKGE